MNTKPFNEVSANTFAGLQVDLIQKLRNNNISVQEFETFLNLSQSKRRALFGMQTLEQKAQRIKDLFQSKSPGNWHFDSNILSWFDHNKVNNESRIEFTLSVETLGGVITSEGTMLDHKRSIELPLLQALDEVIRLLEKDELPPKGTSTLIFLSTKIKNGSACKLNLWHNTNGKLRLHVYDVDRTRPWDAERRVLRKSSGSVIL